MAIYMILHANRSIEKYCQLKQANGLTKAGNCMPALPLSKINKLSTSTNNTSVSCRMRYAETIRLNSATMNSTSALRKVCGIGGPTFSY